MMPKLPHIRSSESTVGINRRSGGYDDGYMACPCFWGDQPASLVARVGEWTPSVEGLRVLDAGCGEGKNAIYLARRGAKVSAIDSSAQALANAVAYWGAESANVAWMQGDIAALALPDDAYDITIAYGLLHCLADEAEASMVVRKLRRATAENGLLISCAFNTRRQELGAHPGFTPLLLPHGWYVDAMRDGEWDLVEVSDADLTETHPHNHIRHLHSLTRIVARRRAR